MRISTVNVSYSVGCVGKYFQVDLVDLGSCGLVRVRSIWVAAAFKGIKTVRM